MAWKRTAFRECKSCGTVTHHDPGFACDFFNRGPCKSCGEDGAWIGSYTYRIVFDGVWWKPWTWARREEVKHYHSNKPNKDSADA